jgi:dynactin complex subunit
MKLSDVRLYTKYVIDGNKIGVAMFKGKTLFASGNWIGMALERPTGRHNGTYDDVEYYRYAGAPSLPVGIQPFSPHDLNGA